MIYHVNVWAPREGNGTLERPFRRISDAAAIAQPGDEVLAYPGIYREQVSHRNGGTEDKRITYRSVEPLGALITGAEKVSGWVKQDNGLWMIRVDNSFFSSFIPYTVAVSGE